jgi:hypothetical protein
VNVSVEQALQQQVRDEIGDEENIKFPRKNQLNLKYGIIPPIITAEEILYWEMRLEESNG